MLLTRLNFREEILLETFVLLNQIKISDVTMCFFTVKHHIGDILGMVCSIDIKEKKEHGLAAGPTM